MSLDHTPGARRPLIGSLPRPLAGATKVPLSGFSWTAYPPRAQSNINTSAAPPNDEYGTEPIVRMWVDPADLAGWDIGTRATITSPVVADDAVIHFRLYLKEYPSNISGFARLNVRIRLSIDAAADTFNNYVELNQQMMAGRWTDLTFGGPIDTLIPAGERTGVTVVGTIPEGATFKRMEILTGGTGGVAPDLYLQQVAFGGANPSILIFSGDDLFDTFPDTMEIFEEFAVPTTMNMITGNARGVDSVGKLTKAQAQGFIGNPLVSFGGHMETHPTLAEARAMSEDAIYGEMVRGLDFMITNGFNDANNSAYDIAIPFGADGYADIRPKYVNAARRAGIRSIRGTGPSATGYGRGSRLHGACVFLDVTAATANAPVMKRRIRQLKSSPGTVLRIGYHRSGPGSSSNDYPTASFREVVQCGSEERNAGKILIMTEAEYQSQPILGALGL